MALTLVYSIGFKKNAWDRNGFRITLPFFIIIDLEKFKSWKKHEAIGLFHLLRTIYFSTSHGLLGNVANHFYGNLGISPCLLLTGSFIGVIPQTSHTHTQWTENYSIYSAFFSWKIWQNYRFLDPPVKTGNAPCERAFSLKLVFHPHSFFKSR